MNQIVDDWVTLGMTMCDSRKPADGKMLSITCIYILQRSSLAMYRSCRQLFLLLLSGSASSFGESRLAHSNTFGKPTYSYIFQCHKSFSSS
jgi:hypothetical protein